MGRKGKDGVLEGLRPYVAEDAWGLVREAVEKDPGEEPGERFTALGSRCARSWDEDWLSVVNAAEAALGRRICGARTLAGSPCSLEPNHSNGRCRFHGGFALTGAPPGNRNALLHGLYSRRLLVCGTHCALWESCPCAREDVLALPAGERPVCPYEQTEYNAFVTDAAAKSDATPDPDPLDLHMVHTLALLQVMMNRAAAALSVNPLTETTLASTGEYRLESVKLNTLLQAFLRIGREYRAFREQFDRNHFARARRPEVSDVTALGGLAHASRRCVDTDLEPESQDAALSESAPNVSLADRFMRKATKAASYGEDVAMLDAMRQALLLDPVATHDAEDAMLAAYRPREGSTLPENAVRHILEHLKIDPRGLYPESNDALSEMRRAAILRNAGTMIRHRKRRPRGP